MTRKMNGYLIFGIVMSFVWGGHLVTQLLVSDAHRWTPASAPLALNDAGSNVEIQVAGQPLKQRMHDGTLMVRAGDKPQPVQPDDIGIRLNHADRIRAARLPMVAFSGVGFGMGLMSLVAGAVEWRRRGQSAPHAATLNVE